jgi:ketosteroid isomerase-like protein
MSHKRVSTLLATSLAIAVLVMGSFAINSHARADADRESLEQTSAAIRAAFARGDIPAIMSYHHPDVAKSLNYGHFLEDRDAVQADITALLKRYTVEWKENSVRSLFIQGDTAVELTDFTIQGTPKSHGEPFTYRGRAMVVYVRFKDSPSGWASIREIIQPAT